MSYRLESDAPLPTEIKRIACEQIDRAIDELHDTAKESRNEAIHAARKRFKKIRAVLRLIRDELGKQNYQQENICFRDAGRRLSEVRDARVAIETLDKLKEHFAESLAAEAFTDLRQILVVRHNAVCERVLEQENAVVPVLATIKVARARVNDWSSVVSDDWSALGSGLHRVYQRGFKALSRIEAEPTVENLHEWRKRVKYLWYHLRILRPVWSDLMAELVEQTHQLAKYLGDDRDLAVLRQLIGDLSQQLDDNQAECDLAVSLINRRRQRLQSAAHFLGQKVYVESAEAFSDRIGAYWRIWQEEDNQI